MFQNNQADDYHVFVTDSVWMRELGLSTFTTGTLYDWWYHRGQGGKFVNRPLVGGSQNDPSPSIFFEPAFAGITAVGQTPVWRYTGVNKGKYEDMNFDQSWNFTDGRPISDKYPWHGNPYSMSDANLDFWDDITGDYGGLLDGPRYLNDTTPGGIGRGDTGITNIVAINDHLRQVKIAYPDFTDTAAWDTSVTAKNRLIEDIKTSKSGCLVYPMSMTFDVAPGQTFSDGAGGLVPAYKTEEFTIKLFLYDEKTVRKSEKIAILTSTKHAGVPRDVLGRTGNQADGEIDDVDGTDSSNQVVGDIDLSLNPRTGKWQSGSKQILAKITQTVPSATWLATVEDLDSMDTPTTLDDPNDPKHLVMGTGAAMPISMQNGNPMQWAPNYLNPKACRKDNKDKFLVTVHNPDPGRTWDKEKIVLLNEIDGVWMPTEFGTGIPTGGALIDGSFDGGWDFTYCATSLEFFFRDQGDNKKITPDHAEKAFHVQYYEGDDVNWNVDPADYPHPSIKGATSFTGWDAYHQFSSFDFMDKNIAGTRGDKRSLGATLYGKDPMGTTSDQPSPEMSGPFFGCVFPDGYKTASESVTNGSNTYGETRNFQVVAQLGIGGQFFHVDGIPGGTKPFDDGVGGMDLARHAYIESPADKDGKIIPMFAAFGKGDASLKHLPADIALNASPVGKNGRPLTSIENIAFVVHAPHLAGGVPTREWIRYVYFSHDYHVGLDDLPPLAGLTDKPNAYNWLYKAKYWEVDKPETINYDENQGARYLGPGYADDSAFDFSPKKSNRIQFRPLKMEVYASMVDAGKTTPSHREDVWHWARQKMDDGKSPASVISRDRNRFLYDNSPNPLYGRGDINHQGQGLPQEESWGLKFNVDYPPTMFSTNDSSSRFSDTDSWKYDFSAFPWRHFEPKPAGAVGIIGAISTVTASLHVTFDTTQNFGMDADYAGSYGGVSIGDIPIIGPRTNWSATWGGGSVDFDDFHTTNLSVRIYQAWPRGQTIYDPRYFAVHHFNDGVSLIASASNRAPGDTNLSGKPDHLINVAESHVDIREPSYVTHAAQLLGDDNGPTLSPILASVGQTVLRDGIAMEPIVPSGMWQINANRRGKLLPYNYSYKAVTIPWGLGKIINTGYIHTTGVYYSGALPQTSTGGGGQEFIDDPTNGVVETKSVNDVQMVIQDLGHDYKKGDQFAILGSDAVLRVEMVGDFISNSGGTDFTYHDSIMRFEVIDPGTYFDHTKCLPSGDATTNPVKSYTQGAAKIEPLHSSSVNGKGFKAYVAQGTVSEVFATDAKPKIATEEDYYQLSLPASNFEKISQEHNQMVAGSRTVKAIIDPDLASPDGRYDLFFHFHNDISHTWFSKGDWGTYANNEDQYVELNISPV